MRSLVPRDDTSIARRCSRAAALRWSLAGALLIAFGLVLGALVASDAALSWELDAMIAVQRLPWPGLDTLAWAASRIGDSWPGMAAISAAAIAICLWRGRGDLALLMLAATAARAIGPPLKWLFASPRPPIASVAVLDHATGFGYPSGHALGAALVYGAIAVIAPHLIARPAWARFVQAAALAMMLLIALSRVRLGVHWPTDVVGGVAFGLGIVCLLHGALLAAGKSAKSANSGGVGCGSRVRPPPGGIRSTVCTPSLALSDRTGRGLEVQVDAVPRCTLIVSTVWQNYPFVTGMLDVVAACPIHCSAVDGNSVPGLASRRLRWSYAQCSSGMARDERQRDPGGDHGPARPRDPGDRVDRYSGSPVGPRPVPPPRVEPAGSQPA